VATRLLVADDDADMRQSMRLLLQRAGYEVELAADGACAHREAQRILVTGFGQEADRSRARQAGFDEHLVKPVDPDMLRCTLELIPWKHAPAAR
jgi:CheY-like chemotaxis protein